MKVDNLEVGQVVKNYKELCSLLELDVKAGNSRKAQIKELERFIDYEKKGHSFIVKEIYSEPLEIDDARSNGNNVAPYIQDMELLLIDLLLCSNNEEIKIPTNALLEVLKIVNYNYRYYMYDKRNALSKDLEMDIDYINDYYDNVGAMLTSNINTVINRLERRKLIIHNVIHMIKVVKVYTPTNDNGIVQLIVNEKLDDDGNKVLGYEPPKVETMEYFREATTNELRKILSIEREIYEELGMDENSNYSDLYRNGKKETFKNLLNKRLLAEMNILMKFKSHHIIFNNKDIEKEKKKLMSELDRKYKQGKVNKDVQSRINSNANSRIEKYNDNFKMQYLEHFGDEKQLTFNKRKMLVGKKEYEENYNKLNEKLIENGLYDLSDIKMLAEIARNMSE